jgi:hypothetical protein
MTGLGTVQRHPDGTPPEIVALCHRFSEPVSMRGPLAYAAALSRATAAASRASSSASGPWTAAVDLRRRAADPLFVSYSSTTAREDPDDSVAALLRVADGVGEGGHRHQ